MLCRVYGCLCLLLLWVCRYVRLKKRERVENERRRTVGDRGLRHESWGEVRAQDKICGARVVERTGWRVVRDL